ncbi:MAG TPA: hypothetical protein VL463_28570 [Kofleriaceae bacterium]|nr:hypothetical protein [Kofleriaceae bacterium]
MKTLKTMLLAGVALAGLGGIAAADPCDPPAPQPTYGTYQNGSYEYNGYQNGYQNGYDDYDYRTDEASREAANREPAPGTYQNGYVWVAGAYSYPNGIAVWMPGHWVAAAQPAPVVVTRPPVVIYRGDARDHRRGRTARSYRWRSRW